MELKIAVEGFQLSCDDDRCKCALWLALDPAAAVSLLIRLGSKRGCRIEGDAPVEVEIFTTNVDSICNRDGCALRIELSEKEARHLREHLVSFCR